jgi:hypothetical protein
MGRNLDRLFYSRYKPRRSAARWLEGAPSHVVAIYDSGPNKFADRYTVVYGAPLWNVDYVLANVECHRDPRLVPARGMSDNPFHPQGVGLFCEVIRGPHLGRKIKWADLPERCKQCVIQDGKDD